MLKWLIMHACRIGLYKTIHSSTVNTTLFNQEKGISYTFINIFVRKDSRMIERRLSMRTELEVPMIL